MTARLLLFGATYDPETVQAMVRAFDGAWACVHQFYGSREAAEDARMTLAGAILLAARDKSLNVEQLKAAGLAFMTAHHGLEPDDMEATMRINTAQHWRACAEEAATIAAQMTDSESRRLLMVVSQAYAELARRALAQEVAASNKAAAK
jgi:plasmid stability protein